MVLLRSSEWQIFFGEEVKREKVVKLALCIATWQIVTIKPGDKQTNCFRIIFRETDLALLSLLEISGQGFFEPRN